MCVWIFRTSNNGIVLLVFISNVVVDFSTMPHTCKQTYKCHTRLYICVLIYICVCIFICCCCFLSSNYSSNLSWFKLTSFLPHDQPLLTFHSSCLMHAHTLIFKFLYIYIYIHMYVCMHVVMVFKLASVCVWIQIGLLPQPLSHQITGSH